MLFQNDWAHIQHAAALRRRREYAGPSLFSFFLCGAMWAALAALLRLPQVFWRAVAAHGAQPTGLAHPWLCGYVAAIAAYGIRLGIAAAIGLMLIGGRLVRASPKLPGAKQSE